MALTKASAAVLNIDDLYGFRNRVINGDMRIDQRSNGSSVSVSTGSAAYPVDRFLFEQGGITSNAGSIQRVADAPTGFSYSAKYTAGATSYASSSGWGGFSQRIEGFNVSDLMWGTSSAKTVTLSFWVKASVAGTYTVNMTHYDGSQERWNNITYTINSTNTWEYKTLTFNGDTSYGIANDNGTSGWMRLYWHLGDNAGQSSTTTTLNTWFNGAASKRGASGTTDIMSTAGRTWQITGVQLETGSVATPFERRPYGLELQLCQRYYWQDTNSVYYPSLLDGTSDYPMAFVQFPVPMRTASPSASFLAIGAFYYNNGSAGASFTPSGGTTAFSTSTDSFGGIQQRAISNSPGSTHGQKSGQWYVKVAVSAEL